MTTVSKSNIFESDQIIEIFKLFFQLLIQGLKVKELEDLTDVQKILLDKLRGECKTLASHIEDSQSTYT